MLAIIPNGRDPGGCGIAADQIRTAAAYLRLLRPTKTVPATGALGSYTLKHCAERWGRAHGMAPYVTNGALIAAAAALGLPMRDGSGDSPNVAIGVAHADVDRIEREVADLLYPPPAEVAR
jgi:hypothetical protein